MLLSARRSLVLLPAAPPPAGARNLALLRAAAERLGVPLVSANSPNWKVGLATGRNQLIAAGLPGEPEMQRLPPGTKVFVVVDCLAEDARPAESAWAGMAATPVSTEMVVFEWLERGATAEFRDLIKRIR